jgi:signal peptidase
VTTAVMDSSDAAPSAPDDRRRNRSVADRLLGAVWLLAFAVLAVLVWPTTLGGATSVTIVAGSSMEPTYHTGDAVIVRRGDDPVVGDVIVYAVPAGEAGEGRNVIHRVVGGDADQGYVTRGDNRESDDPWHPRRDDVRGVVRVLVPQVGSLGLRLLSPPVLGLVAAGLFAWVAWPRRSEREDESDPADG